MKWAGYVARIKEMRNAYKIFLSGNLKGRRRPRSRWEDNIKMELREIGWEVVDWMHLTQERDQRWAFV
jgi:hypothetical protein